MRVILDTNVLVSGIFFGGNPLIILHAWKNGDVKLVVTQDIFEEYTRVINGLSKKYSYVNVSEILDAISTKCEFIQSGNLPIQICDDPDDDKFLYAALMSKVKLIISGDKLLLETTGWQSIQVITPSKFVSDFL